MNDNQIECFDCGKICEESEIEACIKCEEDFCDNCLNTDGYCLECKQI